MNRQRQTVGAAEKGYKGTHALQQGLGDSTGQFCQATRCCGLGSLAPTFRLTRRRLDLGIAHLTLINVGTTNLYYAPADVSRDV
jgi:hypothetical protein